MGEGDKERWDSKQARRIYNAAGRNGYIGINIMDGWIGYRYVGLDAIGG